MMRKPSAQPLEVASPTDATPGDGRYSPDATAPLAQRSGPSSPVPNRSPQPVLWQRTEDGSQGQGLPVGDGNAALAHHSSDPAPSLSGAAEGQEFELGDDVKSAVPTSAPGVLGLGVGSGDSGLISQGQKPALGSKMASAAAAFSRRGGRRRR